MNRRTRFIQPYLDLRQFIEGIFLQFQTRIPLFFDVSQHLENVTVLDAALLVEFLHDKPGTKTDKI